MRGVTSCRLALDKRVREKALQVRLQYIKKLESLFQQRRKLNIEAVKVLLPILVFGRRVRRLSNQSQDSIASVGSRESHISAGARAGGRSWRAGQ